MRIFLEVNNKRTGFHLADYVTFDILSCCAPSNLWLLRDFGPQEEYGITTHNFAYKKVVSLMETITVIDGKEFHGQVATLATGNENRMYNAVLHLGEEHTQYGWEQPDNDYCCGGLDVYTIDLDELRQSKEYKDLSVDECFSKLLINPSMGYELLANRYVTNEGKILNTNERYPE